MSTVPTESCEGVKKSAPLGVGSRYRRFDAKTTPTPSPRGLINWYPKGSSHEWDGPFACRLRLRTTLRYSAALRAGTWHSDCDLRLESCFVSISSRCSGEEMTEVG